MEWSDYLDAARDHWHPPVPAGWLSCSALPSIASCSYYQHRETTGGPQLDGQACHLVLADGHDAPRPDGMPDDLWEIVAACWAELARLRRELEISNDAEMRVEQQVSSPELRICGTPDLVLVDRVKGVVVVVDWKTGRKAHTHRLIQTHGYAECLRQEFPAYEIWCHVVQPLTGHAGEWYDDDEAARLRALLTVRRPATQCADCDWCACAWDCSVLHRAQAALQRVRPDDLPDEPNRLAQILDACYAVGCRQREATRIRDLIKARMVAGAAVPGWSLTTRRTREIRDPAQAFGLMAAAGLSVDAVQRAATWTWADLYRIAEEAGKTRREIDELLAGVCEVEETVCVQRDRGGI